MTMFGLKEAEVSELIRAVTDERMHGALDRDAIEERFARSVWSGITEPGDRVAGTLIGAIGATAALTELLGGLTGDAVTRSLEGSVTRKDLALARDRWAPRLASATALTSLRQAVRLGVRLTVPGDPEWIPGVDDLASHAPTVLWMRGRCELLAGLSKSVAMVGARAATGYGEHVTMESSAGLVDRGFAIVSGAAYGIDGMAHRAALASNGVTVAFLAGGVDRFYPSGHDALLTRIVESGCVISELPCGAQPSKWRFLQRNRLIAAASRATVVLEAGWRSGSLNTAHHAAALGRPLGAVPGPVTSAASAGCHRLIREDLATLVTTAHEMAELAGDWETDDAVDGAAPEDPRRVRVLDAISTRAARQPTDIAARSGLSLLDVMSALGALDLEGIARETPRGWVRRVLRDT
ncbi:DNA processing protein [Microbacteriaceae bacterium SG_E_30_P1]|uniref:DNA processing protein n=1 Tax=Antiquaquibacter oligotrophicus TaxID=2880260 RepID=A0ABT6KN27_9MICO|nr:DNA-processing protein DprA [Antiquaquibacter oligotrophicus]MDH6181413.1 DNA processing protein [Antiquaquibacter oligotrophicus]UDF12895.1 DNA-processing protein DprA [Antiquaquibacter oligotrophicus]